MAGSETTPTKHTVRKGRPVGTVISVRLKPEEADLLEALSERDGRTLSETLRVALHTLATVPVRPDMSVVGAEGSFTRGGSSPDEDLIVLPS